MGIPWVALGGGGYDMGNVARCWTLAWAIMAGKEIDDLQPENTYHLNGLDLKRLRDEKCEEPSNGNIEDEIEFLIEKVLPLIKAG